VKIHKRQGLEHWQMPLNQRAGLQELAFEVAVIQRPAAHRHLG
jgi:hypothetical protein